jgi:UDP-N-acetylmuramoyl-tripeptide--D-alanyl-D-alanine ligase
MPKLIDVANAVLQAGLATFNPDQLKEMQAIEFTSVSTDSRSITPGQLFIALVGPSFNGHAFIDQAFKQGAVAAVVQESVSAADSGPLLQVSNTLTALQAWATAWRKAWHGQLIAVTGSNGKTTVKKMIADILAQEVGSPCMWATPGNLNNHIGLPLSVLGLQQQQTMAVLELGMNHPGEIAMLAKIAQPTIGLVNNAQREHQEFMKSVEAVAIENGQVFAQLPPHGVAVFPKDSLHEGIWQSLAGTRRMIRFGLANDHANDSAQKVTGNAASVFTGEEVIGKLEANNLHIRFPNQAEIKVQLNSPGQHVALNALAAASCAFAANCSLNAIESALNAFAPVKGRGQQHALAGGGLLIDDTYNANPDSVRAAIDALITLPRPQALVLGDMGEVGEHSDRFHQEVLRHADQQGVKSIWLHGQATGLACQQTGIGQHFAAMPELISQLDQWVRQQQSQHCKPSVWVKGSRFMKMERAIGPLTESAAGATTCI